MTRYLGEAQVLLAALKASRPKIIVFVGSILSVVVIIGSMMHLIEGPENGFTSIPKGMYWAIVTLTTVGYGDVAPKTVAGQTLAAVIMILGYGVIAVPTGIVSVELSKATDKVKTAIRCLTCSYDSHDIDARFCKKCGSRVHLNDPA
jgi:voltage-gated potassium channel